MSRYPAPQPVNSITDIELDSHLLIEASAGTGKTHTIEELVVELLVQGKTSGIDRILVVTFTETATAELKEKIRKKIEQKIKERPSPVLRESLDNFDTASIYTIHGFCNRVLSTFAFENSEEFGGTLTGDQPVYEKVLRRIMQEQWPALYGNDLEGILTLSHFPDKPGKTRRGEWIRQILKIVGEYQPMAGDALVPEPVNAKERFRMIEEKLKGILEKLSGLIGPISENVEDSPFYQIFSKFNIHKTSQGKNLKIIRNFLELLRIYREDGITLPLYMEFVTGTESGFPVLKLKWNKGGDADIDTLPALMDIMDALEHLSAVDLKGVQHTLASQTIAEIRRQSGIYKEGKGLISYDDMIERVSRAVEDDTLPLRQALQQHYSHALVDEFQDTDMLQWNIFKRVFLQGKKNRLFIIGDPKQAIYNFRGADINAYYAAREEMLSRHGAGYYSLRYNWRSLPSLISSFNGLFGQSGWFVDSGIDYVDNEYPPEKEGPDPDCPSQSLIIADLGKLNGAKARLLMAEFAADEIASLISDPSGRYSPDKIAVLTRNWSESYPLESALDARGIAYSCYKRKGLYQSREAAHLCYLLDAIEDPSDSMLLKKTLLTDFFGMKAQDLAGCEDIPMSHPVHALLSQWHGHAIAHEWSLMFQSIREDSGMLYRMLERENAEQSLSAYSQIFQDCESEAIRENLGIDGIIEFLNRMKNNTGEGIEGENIFRTGSEEARVQIMTIHASKGLQFRVVFLAGGYTRPKEPDYWNYHLNESRIFDLCKTEEGKKLYRSEQAGEDRRLYYVALTRAEELLYVPCFTPERKPYGFVGSALREALEFVKDSGIVRTVFVESEPSSPLPKTEEMETIDTGILLPDPIFPHIHGNFLGRKTGVTSFSAIKSLLFNRAEAVEATATFGEEMNPKPEYDEFTRNSTAMERSMEELPRGAETGTMLHEILEEIDFSSVQSCSDYREMLRPGHACLPIIEKKIKTYLPETGEESKVFRESAARLIWNTLRAPLDESGFSLGMITDHVKEMEFHFPAPSPVPGNSGATGGRVFIHGFIDLVFRHGGRYYLLDWKSNYLEQGYSRKAIEENINRMHYNLQYNIYTQALIRWLRAILPEFSIDAHFGGIYYIYLRGMDEKRPGNGIFFLRPDSEEISRYESEITYSTQTIEL